MSGGWLSIDVESAPRRARIEIRGELDLATSPRLEAELERLATEHPAEVDFELGQLEFLGVEGANLLFRARRVFFPPPCVIRILNPKPIATFVLGLFSLDELIDPPVHVEPDPRYFHVRYGQ